MRHFIILLIFIIALILICPSVYADTMEEKYDQAQLLISEGQYGETADILSGITGYQDASMLSMYARACELAENGDYDIALQSFESLDGFRDSNLQIIYYTARQYEDSGMTENALEIYRSIATFRDCLDRIEILTDSIELQGKSAYWPEIISEDQIRSIEWSLDPDDISVEGSNDLTMLSVSPSGQYIAAVDRYKMDLENKFAAGVPNPYGRLPEAIFLFSREGDHYQLYKTIPIDMENQLELSSMIGGSSAFAWNDDETRVIITCDWGPYSSTMSYINTTHTNNSARIPLPFIGSGMNCCVHSI